MQPCEPAVILRHRFEPLDNRRLSHLCGALDGLFAMFLKQRASSAWEGQTGNLRRWIMQPAKPIAAVA